MFPVDCNRNNPSFTRLRKTIKLLSHPIRDWQQNYSKYTCSFDMKIENNTVTSFIHIEFELKLKPRSNWPKNVNKKQRLVDKVFASVKTTCVLVMTTGKDDSACFY